MKPMLFCSLWQKRSNPIDGQFGSSTNCATGCDVFPQMNEMYEWMALCPFSWTFFSITGANSNTLFTPWSFDHFPRCFTPIKIFLRIDRKGSMKLLIRQGEDRRGGGGMAQFNGGGRRGEAEGRRPCPTTEEDPDSQLQCKRRDGEIWSGLSGIVDVHLINPIRPIRSNLLIKMVRASWSEPSNLCGSVRPWSDHKAIEPTWSEDGLDPPTDPT